MLTDRQSIILCAIAIFGFVVFGILNILDRIYIAGPIILIFIVIIVNLLITKREPENEEIQDNAEQEETFKS